MNKDTLNKLTALGEKWMSQEGRDELDEIIAAERTTSPVSQMTDIEKAAEAIYKLIPANTEGAPEDYPWQPGGNSHMQDLARRMARAALAAAAPHAQAPAAPVAEPVVCSTCNGAGVVDDGEIDCYSNGEPFVCGPVKCVKDCPDCAAPATQQPQDKPNADCSGDPKSCPDNEGYGCACDPMNTGSKKP